MGGSVRLRTLSMMALFVNMEECCHGDNMDTMEKDWKDLDKGFPSSAIYLYAEFYWHHFTWIWLGGGGGDQSA